MGQRVCTRGVGFRAEESPTPLERQKKPEKKRNEVYLRGDRPACLRLSKVCGKVSGEYEMSNLDCAGRGSLHCLAALGNIVIEDFVYNKEKHYGNVIFVLESMNKIVDTIFLLDGSLRKFR